MIKDKRLMINPYTFIFFGPSGSGKGTQAKLLIEYLKEHYGDHKSIYIETGERFREFAKRNNHTSELVNQVLGSGGLLPAFLPIWIWTDFLVDNYTGNEHLVLDGLSRQPHEAPILDSAIKFYAIAKPIVIAINLSREEAAKRLKGRGRGDDTGADILKRLDWYDGNVIPAIQFFRDNSRYTFVDVDGSGTIEEVSKQIFAKVFNDSNQDH